MLTWYLRYENALRETKGLKEEVYIAKGFRISY